MILNLSPALFWDVKLDEISETDNSSFIIQRVCSNGTWNDWLMIREYYGIEKLKTELINARYLDNKSLSFFSELFNVSMEKFRCYTIKQSTKKLWNY